MDELDRKGVRTLDDSLERLREAFLPSAADAIEAAHPTDAAWEWKSYSWESWFRWTDDAARLASGGSGGKNSSESYHKKISLPARTVLLALARCLEQGRLGTSANVAALLDRKSCASALNWMSRGYKSVRQYGTADREWGYLISDDAPLIKHKVGRRFHYTICEPPK